MKNEELFHELEARKKVDLIPIHELEDLLGIQIDDFDERKRRHGYPDSIYYKDFDCEQAGKEKILIDRIMTIGFDKSFLFWRANFPGKHWNAFIILLSLGAVSVLSWFLCVFYDSTIGTYYSVIFAIGCGYFIWFLSRQKFYGIDPRAYYERARKEEYPGDIPILPTHQGN